MALPHQVPLYRALDAIDSRDFESAETSVAQFFDALENDPIALDCRRQHFDRQVFEADFLSILTKEEIDAWGVLATVKLSRGDLEGALSDCHRMIELIDQYYGFDTPSWAAPEARIPINPELMSRYFQIASCLTDIYDQLDDQEMSKRWANVRKTAVSDIQQPEEVWGRWISEEDAAMSVGITIYEFSDWNIEKRESDGREWLANIYRSLTDRVSPHEMKWLVSIHIPTDKAADVPSKAVRWKIWSLRLAVAARLHRAGVGAYFGELQTRGERVLLYYARGEEEVREALGHILEDASELNPVLEIRLDEEWKEYSKWADSSILISSPVSVPMPEPKADEHENDKVLRMIWQTCESIHATSTRLYHLAAHFSDIPPQSPELKKFCIDYLFALAKLCDGYAELAERLPKVDAEAAIRAFDEFWHDSYPVDDENQVGLAGIAKSLAEVAPLKALQIAKALQAHRYSLVHGVLATIAQKLADSDRDLAMQVVQDARKGIVESEEREFSKATYFCELSQAVFDLFPAFSREMLIEAEAHTREIPDSDAKDQTYWKVLTVAKKVAPDKLKEFTERAIANATEMETEEPGYWGFGGPRRAILSQAMLSRYVARYDQAAALALLKHTLELSREFDKEGFDRILHLSHLAEEAALIDQSKNQQFAEEIWFEFKKSMEEVTASDSYFLNQRFETGERSPLIPFVKVNPSVAEARFTSILSICSASALPEREVVLLCTFASELNEHFPKRAKELLSIAQERAYECSSEQLRAESRMLVAATKEKAGLDSAEEYESTMQMVREVFTDTGRFHLLLNFAAMFASFSTKKCEEILNEAADLFESSESNQSTNSEENSQKIEIREAFDTLKRFPSKMCTRLFFLMVNSPQTNDSQRRSALYWFSAQYDRAKWLDEEE